MPVSKQTKEAFKERLITIQPQSFTAACVAQLDKLFASSKEQGRQITVKSWWDNPYQAYQYVFRHRMAEYFLHDFSECNDLFMDLVGPDLQKGGLYFALANWLDWNNQYDLHKRYNAHVNLSQTTGLVLKHPVAILGAAAAISNLYLPEVIHFVDMTFRKDACQLAANTVRTTYTEEVMPKDLMEERMCAAHRALNEIAGCKINGYPL